MPAVLEGRTSYEAFLELDNLETQFTDTQIFTSPCLVALPSLSTPPTRSPDFHHLFRILDWLINEPLTAVSVPSGKKMLVLSPAFLDCPKGVSGVKM